MASITDWLLIALAGIAMAFIHSYFPLGPTPWWHPRGFLVVLVLAIVRFWR
jgi:hypothetical protein